MQDFFVSFLSINTIIWSTIFLPSKLTEILKKKICPDSSLLKIKKTVQMFNNSVNFKDTKIVGQILESYYRLYAIYHLLEIKDDIQVVSQFPCLLGHPVQFPCLLLHPVHIVVLFRMLVLSL